MAVKSHRTYMMLQMIFNVVFVLSPQTLSDVFLVNTWLDIQPSLIIAQ